MTANGTKQGELRRQKGVPTAWNIYSTAWNKCSRPWSLSGIGLFQVVGVAVANAKEPVGVGIAYTKKSCLHFATNCVSAV